MTENETDKSIWNKTAMELTIADQLKVTAVTITAMVVVPVVAFGVADVVGNVRNKFRARRLAKAQQKNEEK